MNDITVIQTDTKYVIFSNHFILVRVYSGNFGSWWENTLVGMPVYYRAPWKKKNIHTFIHTWWYSSVANPHTGMFLEGGRKQNNPEEIQENEGRTRSSAQAVTWAQVRTGEPLFGQHKS